MSVQMRWRERRKDLNARKRQQIAAHSPKAGSTLRSSRAVPHPSTNRALRRLTSEVGRDPVHSTRYGRRRQPYRLNKSVPRPKQKIPRRIGHQFSFCDVASGTGMPAGPLTGFCGMFVFFWLGNYPPSPFARKKISVKGDSFELSPKRAQ